MASNVEDIYRLSPIQEGMLFHAVFDPDHAEAPYTSQFVDDISGPFDPELCALAWQRLTARHTAMRTCFVWEGVDEPAQVVLRQVESSFSVLDWTGLCAEQAEAELSRFTRADRLRGFDLQSPPLHRLTLIRLAPDQSLLVLTVHHLLVDGWSTTALYDELFDTYHRLMRGEPTTADAAPPFASYIAWLEGRSEADAERYWSTQLAGYQGRRESADPLAAAGLPGCGAETPGETHVELAPSLTARVQDFCRERNLTVNTLTQGALAVVLSALTGSDDVMFGAVCTTRPSDIEDIESVVGPLINTLPVRVRVEPDAEVDPWLKELQRSVLLSRQYDHVSLAAIQRWSEVPAGVQLFDCLLTFQNYPKTTGAQVPDLPAVRRRQSDGSLVYPLSVTAQVDERLVVAFSYDRTRYSDELVQAGAELFRAVVTAMVDAGASTVTDLPRLPTHVGGIPSAQAPLSANARLVAYVVPRAGCEIDFDALQRHLRERLPEHMVPSAYASVETLPLTSNGKLDRAALPAPEPRDGTASYVGPRTELERTIARVWGEVLGQDRIGVHENYFALGGDSIESLRIVGRLRKEDVVLSPKDLLANQTVAKLAVVARSTSATDTAPLSAEQGVVSGSMPATPIQCWFLGQDLPVPGHHNQCVVVRADELKPAPLERALTALVIHHDALRTRFPADPADGPADRPAERPGGTLTEVEVLPQPAGSLLTCADLTDPDLDPDEREQRWREHAEAAQAGMDPATGSLVRAVLADLGPTRGRRLLVAVHHMAVDIVSWSILLDDLQLAYEQAAADQDPVLPAKTTSYLDWSQHLVQRAHDPEVLATTIPQWDDPPTVPQIAVLHGDGGPATRHDLALDRATSGQLVNEAPTALGVSLEDLILSALATALGQWSGHDRIVIDIESHGREHLFDDVDLSRTVGWFTSIHPVELTLPQTGAGYDPVATARAVAAHRETIEHKGIDYGILRHLAHPATRARMEAWTPRQIAFNFHGKTTSSVGGHSGKSGLRRLDDIPTGHTSHPDNHPAHALSIDVAVIDGLLHAQLTYRHTPARDHAIRDLATTFHTALADHARNAHAEPRERARASVVPLNDSTRTPQVFCFPYSGGDVSRYGRLAQLLEPKAQVLGLQDGARADGGACTLPEVAAAYLSQLTARQPHGPYILVGWSFGGVVAHEVARQALAAGAEVGLLCLIDTKLPGPDRRQDSERVLSLTARARSLVAEWTPNGPPTGLRELLHELQVTDEHLELGAEHLHDTLGRSQLELSWILEHHPVHLSCPTLLFEASESDWDPEYAARWRDLVTPLTHHVIRGDHKATVTSPGVDGIAAALAEACLGTGQFLPVTT